MPQLGIAPIPGTHVSQISARKTRTISIVHSDLSTRKQKFLRHGNGFAARVRRRYFSEGEKRRPELRLAGASQATRNTAGSKIGNGGMSLL